MVVMAADGSFEAMLGLKTWAQASSAPTPMAAESIGAPRRGRSRTKATSTQLLESLAELFLHPSAGVEPEDDVIQRPSSHRGNTLTGLTTTINLQC
jgi:hypothetical protein